MLTTRQATWSFSCSRAPMWTQDPDQEPHRPYLCLVLDESARTVLNFELTPQPLDAAGIIKLLERTQRSPMVRGAPLGRLVLEENNPDMNAYARRRGFSCALGRPSVLRAEVVAGLADEFEIKNFGRRREALVEKLGPELTRAAFHAAARFWEARPWENLLNSQVILLSEGRYLLVLGSGGEEYGVVMYSSLEALQATFAGDAVASEASLLFGPESSLSFPDLDFHQGPRPAPNQWPLLISGLEARVPEPREARLLLASVLALCELHPTLGSEWMSVPHETLRWKLGPALAPGAVTDAQVEAFVEKWPKVNATTRKIGRVLLEFLQTQEPTEELERHCWRLGALWSERIPRFGIKRLLTDGPCEADYQALHKPTPAALKRYLADWERLREYLQP